MAALLMTGCALGTRQTTPPATFAPTTTTAVVATTAPATATAPPVEPALFPDAWVTPVPWPDTAVAPGSVAVDAGVALGRVNPYLFGSAYGPWVVVPFDLMDEAATAGLTTLRFPGGEWGDRNDLRKDDFRRFVEYARELGVEPTISVRLREGTPEAAAELVRYANVEQGYGIRFWSVGNEPNLYGEGYTIEQFVADWRAVAEAMLAVDPSIVLLGPEVSQYTGDDTPGPDEAHAFLDEFLRVNGDLVDVVTIHRYPFPGTASNRTITIEEMRPSSAEWDRLIPDLRERIRRHAGRDLPVALTEFNSAWTHDVDNEATPDSYYNAVWLADVLGRLIKQRVDMANHFLLVTNDSQGGWGLLGDDAPRPSYYVYQLLAQFGQDLVFAGAADADPGDPVDEVTAYAALRDDGALTLLVVNLGPEAAELPLSLAGHPGGTAEVFRLTEERAADGTAGGVAETVEIADGTSLSLPPQSVSLYVVGP
jgi:alpha-L-arabinofuranosidase